MIKGGFQGLDISDVDLTAVSPSIPGGYATCAAADGKTMRVLTADGVVQCSVKKVSTSYVLAGVTGDGKILGITITNTDGITVSETTVPEPYTPPAEYLDTSVDISSYTSSSPYTTQYDGIVAIGKTPEATLTRTALVVAKIGANHSTSRDLIIFPVEGLTMLTCFVKKGTILYPDHLATGVSVIFLPYKSVS